MRVPGKLVVRSAAVCRTTADRRGCNHATPSHADGTLLGVLVRTLPRVMVAGLIALGGVWVLNNLDLSRAPLPAFLQTSAGDP